MIARAVDLLQIVEPLCAHEGRGPGTDAERRAGRFLEGRLREAGREVEVETHWTRPHWPLVHALHGSLGVGGSLLATTEPVAGLAVLAVTLVSCVSDLTGRFHVLRRITPERATQNLVSPSPEGAAERPVRLVIAAGYDAGHGGLAYRDALRRRDARIRRALGGRWPGPFGLMVAALALLVAVAGARAAGPDTQWLGVVGLLPTVGLLIAVALLLDIALSDTTPGAGDAAGVAVALELAAVLNAAPPQRLAVEVVLAGAAHGPHLGMRGYVRRHRPSVDPERVAVLHIGSCGGGTPAFWTHDGALFPLRLHRRLVQLAAEVAVSEPHLRARPHYGREGTGAYPARVARWPAIAVACLDRDGVPPRSGRSEDTPENLDPAAAGAALELCLALIDRLDHDLAHLDLPPPPP